jgi:undecaprenyl phosphate N,N'-diacetylbacillosamine 1-phosphate transferase
MYIALKRMFDICFCVILLIFTLPLFIVIALVIKMEDPKGPVFFRQKRVGKHNKTFGVFKFRSMIVEIERNGINLTDSERMLRIGNIIRKLSFDELPQIFNIILGDMSFIGPRPLPVKYLEFYTEDELHRHDVRPGISGWAQVNGRNNLIWDKKFELDLYYVKNISFLLDLKIFFLTIKKIFLRSDIGTRGVDIPDVSLHEIRQKRITEKN